MKVGFLIMFMVGIVGMVGSSDRQHDLESATVNTCTQSAQQLNRWASQCDALIKQTETAYPNDEVLSDTNGNYWVEVKGKN